MNFLDIIKPSQITESKIQRQAGALDFVARVSRTTSSDVTVISTMDTNTFITQLRQFDSERQADINALNAVVNWQHKIIDFNSSYTAFLLDQISEDEFEKIAEEMAEDETDRDPSQIVPLITRILSLTTLGYTPSDFANMLHCSQQTIIEALKEVAYNNPKIKTILREILE